ncbi:sensor histidine kinase [Dielma fastidiosa]
MWIKRISAEYRTISTIPAFSSMDVRGIEPQIERFTNSYTNNGEVMETFSYIGKNGFCWINSDAIENLMDNQDYQKAYRDDSEFIISKPKLNDNNREVLLFYYPIKSITNQKEALIVAAIPSVRLNEIVNTMQVYNGKSFIMSRDYDLITTNEQYFYSHTIDEETLHAIDIMAITSSNQFPVTDINGKAATLFVSPIENYPEWIFATVVSNEELMQSSNQLMTGLWILLLFLLAVIFILGKMLVTSVLTPIKNLQNAMKLVENGKLESYVDEGNARDEIHDLSMSFNKMISKMSELIDQIVEERNQKQRAEMEIMQAQIKPHFLYNTLDNLKWLAKQHGAEDVAKTITALSTYFRTFLASGQQVISLKQEFKHTKAYLDMQKIRFKNLDYEIYCPKELETIQVVKILLQPLVENSIHACTQPNTHMGKIIVRAMIENECLMLSVEDNGCGMDEQEVKELLDYLHSSDTSKHFGLHNVYTRLKMMNQENDILIDSIKGEGCKITLLIKEFDYDKNDDR